MSEHRESRGNAGPLLVDTVEKRILLAPIYLLRATFTDLTFMEARYRPAFEKIAEHMAGGERVVAWRINWPDSMLEVDGATEKVQSR